MDDKSLAKITYKGMLNLHKSWQRYATQLVAAKPAAGAENGSLLSRLGSLELSGAYVHVAACAHRPQLQDSYGIVVSARPSHLALVLRDNRKVRVPRPGTRLELVIGKQKVVFDFPEPGK